MTWKIDGKIAAHFPGAGAAANRDTYRIVFSPANAQQTSDLEEIEKVYYVPAGSTVSSSNLQNYLVWKRYWEEPPVQKTLINDDTTDQYLMIKYKPASNINVSKVAVLVDPSGNGSGSDCLVIVNDQGLLIYSAKNQSQESTAADTTLYEYTGYKRTRTFNNSVTLYAGKTYWIHYHFNSCRNHRGAYFENSNGKYKDMGSFSIANFAGNTAYPEYANKTIGNTYDVSSTGNINTWEKLDAILRTGAVENDLILLTSNDCGLRTSIASGLTYYGNLQGTNGYNITESQLNLIPIGNSFIIKNSYSQSNYAIYKCKSHITEPDSGYSNLGPDTIQSLLNSILINTNKAVSYQDSYFRFYDLCHGATYIRTDKMTVNSTVWGETMPTPSIGTIYAKNDSNGWPEAIGYNACIAVYTDDGWVKMTSLDQSFTINGEPVKAFNKEILSDCYEEISTTQSGNCGTLLSMNKSSFIQYYDNGSGAQAWNTTQTGKTFYLEINDTEKSDDAERA